MSRRFAAFLLAAGLAAAGFARAEPAESGSSPEPSSHPHDHHEAHRGHWHAPKPARSRKNPVKPSPAVLERGGQLYREHCTACHGEGGEGDGALAATLPLRPANLKQMVGHHSDGDLAWKIAEGRGAMPGWKQQLDSRDIWSLVHYLRQLARH